jgi:ATP-dependent DNA helicase RecQ
VELGIAQPAPAKREADPDDPVFAALKRWRLERAKAEEVPAYVVFHNSTLAEVAARKPRTRAELASVPGVGPTKLERYGDDLLAALASA